MPRVLVVTDDGGQMAWDERATDRDFESAHFRAQFSQRLFWAVSDAGRAEPNDGASDPSVRGLQAAGA